MFKGAYTALVTPFKDNTVDHGALALLVERQITEGIDGIVACGSTGEAFFLTPQEQLSVLKTVKETNKGRVPLIAGTSALKTSDTLELIKNAEFVGVDGLMVVTPPYVKPTQDALYQYFKTLHDASSTPIILYDNPGRSALSLSNDVIIELAKLPRIQCLKDATGELSRPATLLENLPADFTLLSGEDATAPAYFAQGGHGVVSVTSNITPNLVASQWVAWKNRDLERLAQIRTLLNPLHRAMFVESSPAPAKFALAYFDLCHPHVREPLTPTTKAAQKEILKALTHAGLTTIINTEKETHHG